MAAAVRSLPAMIRTAQRVAAVPLLLLLLLLPLYAPVAGIKKGMFRRRNRPGTGDSSGGADGESRNWPWDALNATELEGRSFEYQIKAAVMAEYQKTSRPVLLDRNAVTVFVGFSLFHILDTDEKYQTMKSLISVRLRWIDEYLQWDPEEFGNTTKIWMYANSIWLPDILISNYADDDYKEVINTNVIVKHDGTVLWMYPMVTKTYCEFDVEQFPFDRQVCNVSFFSWTFSSRLMDLRIDDTQANNFYNPHGQEWLVSGISSLRELQIYVCCKDDPFPIITYSIHMQRRSLFYVLNLIFPCLLIYCCAFLGFFLPVESGEKVNLEITILLALVVFLIIAGEVLPPTPDVLPLLGLLYGSSMAMVSVALVMAVVVTNLHYAADTRPPRPVPPLLQRLSRLVLDGCLAAARRHPGRSRSRHRRRCRLLCPTSAASCHLTTPPAADDRCGRRLARSALAGATPLPQTSGSRESSPCGGNGDAVDDLEDDAETPLGRPLSAEDRSAAAEAARSGGIWNFCCQLISAAKLDRLREDLDGEDDPGNVSNLGDWRAVARAADRLFFWAFLGITVTLMGHMLTCAVAA